MSRIFSFALAVVMAGCGGKVIEESAAPTPKAVAEPVLEQESNPFHAGDEWRGTYTCAQGLTQLELEIVAAHGNVVDDAVFDFDWVDGDSKGSFHMNGTFDPATGKASLERGAWIDDPGPNWLTVSMDGDAQPTTFTGDVIGPGCTTFSLTKE